MELIYNWIPEDFVKATQDTTAVSEKASNFILQFRVARSADVLLKVSENILVVSGSLTIKHEFVHQIQPPNGLMSLLAFVGVSSAWDYEKQEDVQDMISAL